MEEEEEKKKGSLLFANVSAPAKLESQSNSYHFQKGKEWMLLSFYNI